MKKFIIFLVVFLFIGTGLYSQCKVITKPGAIRKLEKRVPLEIEVFTKYKILFDKYFTVASNCYVKTTDGHYFFVIPFTRGYSSRFELNENTPLIFYFDGGDELKINPMVDIDGKMLGAKYNIFMYYHVPKEQLEFLASSYPLRLRIYFIAEKEISNSFIDDLGTYFEYEMYSNKYRDNVIEGANCILQY